MKAHVESVYDEYEKMAYGAMMNREAQHAKKVKQSQLFKRPIDVVKAKSKAEKSRERTAEAMRWISRFEEFRGKEGVVSGE